MLNLSLPQHTPFISPTIDALDNWLFTKINVDWGNPLFDWFFVLLTDIHRSPIFWMFVLIAAIWWLQRARWRAAKFLFAILLAVSISDSFSFRVLKQNIDRPRPPDSGIVVQPRTDRYAGTSFPSNHAANVSAAAFILACAMPAATWFFVLIAILMSYSRVYVGVHYPLDVLGGACVGCLSGALTWIALRSWINSQTIFRRSEESR